ncbi:MAG TPA: hypothetical protein PKH77_26900 [Anaerolineae bacterium]|nr:hypothetical protein [Anaerolineae bacterium]
MATFDGEMPRSVIYVDRGIYREFTLTAWEVSPYSSNVKTFEEALALVAEPEPQMADFDKQPVEQSQWDSQPPDAVDMLDALSHFAAWVEARDAWLARNNMVFYRVHKNPRFTLPDGSQIWGDECWWSPLAEEAI